MDAHKVVAREEWTTARKALLEREKALTRLRDELEPRTEATERSRTWLRETKRKIAVVLDRSVPVVEERRLTNDATKEE